MKQKGIPEGPYIIIILQGMLMPYGIMNSDYTIE